MGRTFSVHIVNNFLIHYIELPKISGVLTKPVERLSEIEFWCILIMAGKNPKAKALLTKLAQKEEMLMANALLNKMSQDQQEWENQYGYERFVHDCISREKYAFSRGERQGIQQGEHNKALETAQNLLKMSLSIEQVSKAVGLPLAEIQKL